jgi:hypothetical protein
VKHLTRESKRAVVVSPHLALSAYPAAPGRRLDRPNRRRELRAQRTANSKPSSNSSSQYAVHCECPRGTVFNRERAIAMQAGCRRWRCPACSRRKARKVAARFSRLGADVLMTLSLPRSAWATRENAAELQKRCRSLLRYMVRHKLVSAYGWVREEGASNPNCVCHPASERQRKLAVHCETCRAEATARQGCECGVLSDNGCVGSQLHRHFLLRVPRRNGFRRGWLPWAKLQTAAKRCGLGTLDFRAVFSGTGAGAYVSKYLTKSVGDAGGSARRYALSVSIPEIKEAGWSWSPARVALVAVEQLGAVEVDWDATYWDGAPRLFASVP